MRFVCFGILAAACYGQRNGFANGRSGTRGHTETTISGDTRYGVARDRLLADGVGTLSPVATNRSDEGRALNRKVELVER